MRQVVTFAFFLVAMVAYASKPVRVNGEYVYYGPETMSVEEAKRVAIERAKIQALENAFGEKIAQSTSTMITSENANSNIRFSSHGLSDVKGEWIETLGDPQLSVSFQDHNIVVVCRISGMAKELSGTRVEYEACTLKNLPDRNCASTHFSDGDDMFLFFRSPIAGYLNVFLLCDNEDQAYCLLPYKNGKNVFYISADTDYYLFSKEKGGKNAIDVDEYTLTADMETEYNEIVLVFSPEEFNKTSLSDQSSLAPKMTSISKFNDWLSRLRTKNDHVTTSTINITIQGEP